MAMTDKIKGKFGNIDPKKKASFKGDKTLQKQEEIYPHQRKFIPFLCCNRFSIDAGKDIKDPANDIKPTEWY